MTVVAGLAYGVGFVVEVQDEALEPAVRAALPPTHQPADPAAGWPRLRVSRAGGNAVTVHHGDEVLAEGLTPAAAMAALDARLRLVVATQAPGLVFVHAGVAAGPRGAIILPGRTMDGKTELVSALLRAGATYFSDEFAVLGTDGSVRPYPRPLSIRRRGARESVATPAAALGAQTASAPAPVAVVAITRFVAGERWRPQEQSVADGALALLRHAGQARADPGRVLETLERATAAARVLEGPRGEADEAAAALLALVA